MYFYSLYAAVEVRTENIIEKDKLLWNTRLLRFIFIVQMFYSYTYSVTLCFNMEDKIWEKFNKDIAQVYIAVLCSFLKYNLTKKTKRIEPLYVT
jgi:hypothetical protein